jgi:hypothetical protein
VVRAPIRSYFAEKNLKLGREKRNEVKGTCRGRGGKGKRGEKAQSFSKES